MPATKLLILLLALLPAVLCGECGNCTAPSGRAQSAPISSAASQLVLGASSPRISTVVVSVPAAVSSQTPIEALVVISKTVVAVTEKQPATTISSSQEASLKGGPNSGSNSSKGITAEVSKTIPANAQPDLFPTSGHLATQQAATASMPTNATVSPLIDAVLKEKEVTKVAELAQNKAAQTPAKTPIVPNTGPISAWVPTSQPPFLPSLPFPNQYNWPSYGGFPGFYYQFPKTFDYPSNGLFDTARYPYGPLNYAYSSPPIQRPSSSLAAKKLLGLDDTRILVNQIKQQAQQTAIAQQIATPSPTTSPTPASLSLDTKDNVKIGGEAIAIGTNSVSQPGGDAVALSGGAMLADQKSPLPGEAKKTP